MVIIGTKKLHLASANVHLSSVIVIMPKSSGKLFVSQDVAVGCGRLADG